MVGSDFEVTKDIRRKVLRNVIRYKGCTYWHPELATLIGKTVRIVPDLSVNPAKSIEVFDDQNRHIFTVFCMPKE